jgi:hypothetical protein
MNKIQDKMTQAFVDNHETRSGNYNVEYYTEGDNGCSRTTRLYIYGRRLAEADRVSGATRVFFPCNDNRRTYGLSKTTMGFINTLCEKLGWNVKINVRSFVEYINNRAQGGHQPFELPHNGSMTVRSDGHLYVYNSDGKCIADLEEVK